MVLAALAALTSFVGAVGAVGNAGPDTFVVENWRMLGFLVSAGIFALLAFRPARCLDCGNSRSWTKREWQSSPPSA
jgi:hypothetical protein